MTAMQVCEQFKLSNLNSLTCSKRGKLLVHWELLKCDRGERLLFCFYRVLF